MCEYCDIIQQKKDAHIIYEDEDCIAILSESPAVPGHIVLMPKEHYAIIEQVPDLKIGKMFDIANKLSVISFEVLGAKGTNILIQNGLVSGQEVAHFSINIIPRQEKDGMDFQWEMKEATPEELSDAELMLKEETKNMGQFEKEKSPPEEISTQGETIETEEGETDYMIEHLNRQP